MALGSLIANQAFIAPHVNGAPACLTSGGSAYDRLLRRSPTNEQPGIVRLAPAKLQRPGRPQTHVPVLAISAERACRRRSIASCFRGAQLDINPGRESALTSRTETGGIIRACLQLML